MNCARQINAEQESAKLNKAQHLRHWKKRTSRIQIVDFSIHYLAHFLSVNCEAQYLKP